MKSLFTLQDFISHHMTVGCTLSARRYKFVAEWDCKSSSLNFFPLSFPFEGLLLFHSSMLPRLSSKSAFACSSSLISLFLLACLDNVPRPIIIISSICFSLIRQLVIFNETCLMFSWSHKDLRILTFKVSNNWVCWDTVRIKCFQNLVT